MRKHGTDDFSNTEYLVSISDLMAGLLFLFVIALVIFAIRLNSAAAHHKLQVERLSDSQEVRDSLLVDLERALLDRGIEVRIDLDQGVLRIPEKILFASGRADLGLEGIRALGIVAAELDLILYKYAYLPSELEEMSNSHTLAGRLDAVFIEGHTDILPLVPGAPFVDNWHLSSVRAINTYKQMVEDIPRLKNYTNRINQPLFSVSGYADQRPVAENYDEIGRSQNRRIDLRFIMATPTVSSASLEGEW